MANLAGYDLEIWGRLCLGTAQPTAEDFKHAGRFALGAVMFEASSSLAAAAEFSDEIDEHLTTFKALTPVTEDACEEPTTTPTTTNLKPHHLIATH